VPIYEFYCPDCHVIFSFFSSSVNTTKTPQCPRCEKRPLERQMSRFATIKTSGDAADPASGGEPSMDESRMERAMEAFASQADGLSEDDPRQAAQMMRKLSEMAGMNIGPGMEEALKRIEAGEDPEAVESEMGDVLEKEDPFAPSGGEAGGPRKTPSGRTRPPQRDEKLYTL